MIAKSSSMNTEIIDKISKVIAISGIIASTAVVILGAVTAAAPLLIAGFAGGISSMLTMMTTSSQ